MTKKKHPHDRSLAGSILMRNPTPIPEDGAAYLYQLKMFFRGVDEYSEKSLPPELAAMCRLSKKFDKLQA